MRDLHRREPELAPVGGHGFEAAHDQRVLRQLQGKKRRRRCRRRAGRLAVHEAEHVLALAGGVHVHDRETPGGRHHVRLLQDADAEAREPRQLRVERRRARGRVVHAEDALAVAGQLLAERARAFDRLDPDDVHPGEARLCDAEARGAFPCAKRPGNRQLAQVLQRREAELRPALLHRLEVLDHPVDAHDPAVHLRELGSHRSRGGQSDETDGDRLHGPSCTAGDYRPVERGSTGTARNEA